MVVALARKLLIALWRLSARDRSRADRRQARLILRPHCSSPARTRPALGRVVLIGVFV